MNNIEFFMQMIPPTVTAQEKKVSFKSKRFYDEPTLKEAKLKLKSHLAAYVPEKPFDGPLQVVTKWVFPVIKGKKNGQYKHTKPDTHNLNKALFDIMEDLGFFVNDSRVASEIIEKFWGDIPGIYVAIRKLK